MSRRALALTAALAVGVVLAVAGCAPHRLAPPELDRGTVEQRFKQALRLRTERGRQVDGDVSLWIRRRGASNPPGVSGHLRLEAPDAAWLRVDGPLGPLMVAAARGDSVMCEARRLKLAAAGEGVGEAVGLPPVGSLAWRVAAAAWVPPAEAWALAAATDSLVTLAWVESRDSVELGIGGDGLPRRARLRFAAGPVLAVRYVRWGDVGGTAWPAVFVASDERDHRITCRMEGLRTTPPDRARSLALGIPPNAVWMSGDEWVHLFETLTRRATHAPAEDSSGDGAPG